MSKEMRYMYLQMTLRKHFDVDYYLFCQILLFHFLRLAI